VTKQGSRNPPTEIDWYVPALQERSKRVATIGLAEPSKPIPLCIVLADQKEKMASDW
jgi:hypothetical protein